MTFDRRKLIKGIGACTSLGLFPMGRSLLAADAGKGRPVLVVIHLDGGYNSIFASPESLQDKIFMTPEETPVAKTLVTAADMHRLKSGEYVDKSFTQLPEDVLNHMATLGMNHGNSGHELNQQFNHMGTNATLSIAHELGGSSPIKAIKTGPTLFHGDATAVEDVSMQYILNLENALAPYNDAASKTVKRRLAKSGLEMVKRYSADQLQRNPSALESQKDALAAAIQTLSQGNAGAIDLTELKTAYDLKDGTVDRIPSQFAAAELMIKLGANVVNVVDKSGWDFHRDFDGSQARDKMSKYIMPNLNIFLKRMFANPGYNLVVLITAEFARAADAGHAPFSTSTLIGQRVKGGNTGHIKTIEKDKVKVFALDVAQGEYRGHKSMWAAASTALGAPKLVEYFGGDPHKVAS